MLRAPVLYIKLVLGTKALKELLVSCILGEHRALPLNSILKSILCFSVLYARDIYILYLLAVTKKCYARPFTSSLINLI